MKQEGKRKFVHTLCTCCFTDRYGEEKFFPYFCPMALVGTCCIVGRIQTLIKNEPKSSCEMGPSGWACCLVSAPLAVFGPLGGMVYYCFLANVWRNDVVRMYNVEDEKPPCNCGLIWYGCHYPCVFYQLYNSLLVWQTDGVIPSPVVNPILNSEKRTYRVNLPPHSVPGSFVQIILPDGRSTTVQVPPQVLVNPQGELIIDVVA